MAASAAPTHRLEGPEGLYVADTRLLSRLIQEINDSAFWDAGSVRGPGRRTTALTPAARRNR